MKTRAILILILWANVTFMHQGHMEEEAPMMNLRIFHITWDNSTYKERQWIMTRGSEVIEDNYSENCLLESARKNAEIKSRGPLCELCSRVIAKKFPPTEPIKLRYSSFLFGVLTFPPTKDEMLIDVTLCSYDPEIGIDRFYITNGPNESCVYVLENVGWQESSEVANPLKDKKFKFTLEKLIVLSEPTNG